jgi:hypothetical protein
MEMRGMLLLLLLNLMLSDITNSHGLKNSFMGIWDAEGYFTFIL